MTVLCSSTHPKHTVRVHSVKLFRVKQFQFNSSNYFDWQWSACVVRKKSAGVETAFCVLPVLLSRFLSQKMWMSLPKLTDRDNSALQTRIPACIWTRICAHACQCEGPHTASSRKALRRPRRWPWSSVWPIHSPQTTQYAAFVALSAALPDSIIAPMSNIPIFADFKAPNVWFFSL